MAASGPNDELEVQERYNEASIITRIVGNVLKRKINDESAPTPRTRDVALFLQRVVSTLDVLQEIDKTSDSYTSLPEEQKESLSVLYEFCLNDTSHPEEMNVLQKNIQTTMDCVYKNEGSVTNWFHASSQLCGSIRTSLSRIQTSLLDDKYLASVEASQAGLTRDMLTSNRGVAFLTSFLRDLSLTKSHSSIASVIPDAPPPPTYTPSTQSRYRVSVDGSSSSSAPQPKGLSMDELLARREEMRVSRAGKSIEDQLKEAREQRVPKEPASIQDLFLANGKIKSLRRKR